MLLRIVVPLLLFSSALMGQEPRLVPGVYPVSSDSGPGPGLRNIATSGGRRFVRLGSPLSSQRAEIYAGNNRNDLFFAMVYFPGTGCSDSLLQLDAESILSTGYGSDSNSNTCNVFFSLTPVQAARAAAFFKTTRQDRHEIGERLSATFSVSDSLELVVRITNPPEASPVQWQKGGRNRGARDNQFSMRITRDGQPVRTIEAIDLGGLSGMMVHEPGQAIEVRAPITNWGDISIPGRYVVEGAYEIVLTPVGVRPYADGRRGEMWDRRFEGRATFEVR